MRSLTGGIAYSVVIAETVRNIAYLLSVKSFLQFSYSDFIKNYVSAILIAMLIGMAIYLIEVILKFFFVSAIIILCFEILTNTFMLIFALNLPFNKVLKSDILQKLLNRYPNLQHNFIFKTFIN